MKKVLIPLTVVHLILSFPALAGGGRTPLTNSSPIVEVTQADLFPAIKRIKDFVEDESNNFTPREKEVLQAFFDLAERFQIDHMEDPSEKNAALTKLNLEGIICAFIKFFQDSGIEPPPAEVQQLQTDVLIIDTVNQSTVPRETPVDPSGPGEPDCEIRIVAFSNTHFTISYRKGGEDVDLSEGDFEFTKLSGPNRKIVRTELEDTLTLRVEGGAPPPG